MTLRDSEKVKIIEQIRMFNSEKRTFMPPQAVQIDISNQCNLNCVVCWHNSPDVKKKPQEWRHKKMDYDVFNRLVKELAQLGVKEITVVSEGDSFTHPNIIEMIEFIKKEGLSCQVFTNGTLLNRSKIQRLLDCNLDRLFVNLWAADEEVFAKIHPGHGEKFNAVVNSLEWLNDLKLKKGVDKPELHFNTVVFNENFFQLEEIVKLQLSLGARVIMIDLAELADERKKFALSEKEIEDLIGISEKIKSEFEKLQWLCTNIDYFLSTLRLECRSVVVRKEGHYEFREPEVRENLVNKIPCYIGWLFARVNAFGEVSPCCGCVEPGSCLGNIAVSNFKDIWFSERWDEFRSQAVRVGNKGEAFFSKISCLYRCPSYQENVQFHNLSGRHLIDEAAKVK